MSTHSVVSLGKDWYKRFERDAALYLIFHKTGQTSQLALLNLLSTCQSAAVCPSPALWVAKRGAIAAELSQIVASQQPLCVRREP